MNPAIIRGDIYLFDDETLVTTVGGKQASKRIEGQVTDDKFEALVTKANPARITVGLDEKMGGPYGYSSIQVSVSVTLNCDQTSAALETSKRYALDECLRFVEDHMPTAYALLSDHLDHYYTKKD